MNNKKIFSVRMFTQTFLQVKAFGIISTLLITALHILPKISELSFYKRYYSTESMPVQMVNSIEAMMTLIVTFMIITPVLTFMIWNFLNKRSTSDFYHALPYTRGCLFVTKYAVIVVWQLIYVFVPFLSTCIYYALNSKYYNVSYKSLFLMTIVIFICNSLVSAACSLASSIGGNTFSNICVAGFIMFFPRILLKTIFGVVSDITIVFSADKVASLLDDKYNMLFSMTMNCMGYGNDYADIVYNTGAYIYTIALAVIYLVLACVMFKIRKSETAGKAASGKIIPFAIKTLLGFAFSVLGVLDAISTYYLMDKKFTFPVVYVMIILFLLAAATVFIFEFIVSKKVRNVISCIPPIITGYVLAAIAGVFVVMGINNILGYKPDTEDVNYITFSKSGNYYGYDDSSYFDKITDTIQIKDKKVKEIFTKALSSNIEMVNKVHEGELSNFTYSSKYKAYSVYYDDGMFGKYRTVYLTDDQISKIGELIIGVPEYKEAYTSFPDADDVTVNFYQTTVFSKEDCAEIYKTYVDEVSKLKFDEWYMIVNSYQNYETVFEISFEKKGIVYTCELKIGDRTPKALAKYIEINNRTVKDKKSELVDKMSEMITGLNELSDDYVYINISDYKNDIQVGFDSYEYKKIVEGSDINAQTVLSDIKNGLKNGIESIDLTKPIIRVSGGIYDQSTGIWDDITLYFQIKNYDEITDFIPESQISNYKIYNDREEVYYYE
ncbi:MAG: hypothetical protein ACI4E1_06920 [Lachnospira sp.]